MKYILELYLMALLTAGGPDAEVKGLKGREKDGKAEVDLSLTVEGALLVDFDMFASRIDKFTDNRGTDLGAKAKGVPDYETMPIYASAMHSEEKPWTITVQSPKKPSEDASEFTVEGELVIKYAEKIEKDTVKNLKIEDKEEVSLGELRGKVVEVERKEEELEFALEFDSIPEGLEVKEIEIQNAEGKDLHGGQSKTRTKVGGRPEVLKIHIYGIRPPVDELNLEYELWVGLKELKVPYKVTVEKE